MRKFTLMAVLLCGAFFVGCSDKHDEHDHSDHKGAHTDAESDIDAAMKGLSEADRALARTQKTCPVSGEDLGSMGTPIQVTGGGKTVFLCCEGCRKKFEKDPEKYVKKLGG